MRPHSYHTISPRRGMTLLAALSIVAMGSAYSQTSAGGHADDASNVANAASAHTALPAHASTAVHPELWPKAHWPLPADATLEHRVQTLLAKMTVAEKVGQVIQADIESVTPADVRQYHLGSILAGGNSKPGGGTVATPAQWLQLADAFHKASIDTSDGGVGIPLLFGFDAVHGANDVVGATLFPQNSALGATRDPELVRKIGAATAAEARAVGVNWTFAPALAVPRDDRWGRTYEGYSENPTLVAKYATAMVEGLQGTPGTPQFLDGSHVIASAKHYLGDGSTHNGKDQGDARISEKQLRDIAGAGYPPAINAGVQTVMASFSSWNGMKMTGSKSLLTDVLKQRMDFQGFIVGDWNAQGQLPGCTTTDCPQAINAGLDMYMAPDSWKGLYKNTLAEVKSGRIPMTRLDDAVERILRVKFRIGLFEQGAPSQQALGGKFQLVGSPQHRALARRAVRESLVLLKNRNHLLPLDPEQRILVAGDGADSIAKQSGGWTLTWQGTGTTRADFPSATSIWEGIRKQVHAAGGQAELAVDGHYKHKPDVAIVVYGEDPYAEYMGDIPTLDYAPNDTTDMDLLKRLHAQGIPVVSVFLTGRPLWVNPEINASDAFVVAWLPGSEGEGVADVLLRKASGDIQYDFHGKLAFSWPRTAMQTPLNIGQKNYDPQFAYGYGLRYGDNGNIGHLSEASAVSAASLASGAYLHNGTPEADIVVQLTSGSNTTPITVTSLPAATGNDELTVSTEDYQRQESARRLAWSGEAAYQLRADETQDLSSQTANDAMLVVTMKIDHLAPGTVTLGMASGTQPAVTIPVTTALSRLPTDTWMRVGLPLQCLQRARVDMRQIRIPFHLQAAAGDVISLTRVELGTEADHTLPCTTQPN